MKHLLFTFLLIVSVGALSAQSFSGQILEEDQSPVVGALVQNLKSTNHTHTDEDGSFSLDQVVTGDSIEITYLGFETQRIIIDQLTAPVTIVLKPAIFDLKEVTVRPSIDALNVLTEIDMQINPVQSAQEVLQTVPGLFIGQHAGGGKAEQIFLRGFDIDHGTDIAISVDGLPVNMVSHSHGQGYADLHFIIPELISGIDFGKGSYTAEQGNFNTAGYVDFKLRDRLDGSKVQVEAGQFNTIRTLALVDLMDNARSNAYIGTELLLSDGPFESSQHFSRLNTIGRFNVDMADNNRLSVWFSHFESKWDASGQVPQRAVDDGSITRFGAIDDTEGGFTSRTNLVINHRKSLADGSFLQNHFGYSKYDFELFSNFTFFLDDPTNGDQIRQAEDRHLFHLRSTYNRNFTLLGNNGLLTAGVGGRYDNVDDNILANTLNRKETRSIIRQGDIDEFNLYGFLQAEWRIQKWIFSTGLRLDYFQHNYVDNLQTLYNRQDLTTQQVSPKVQVLYQASPRTQLFAKAGVGFHSNDTRTLLGAEAEEVLPAALGVDVGGISQIFDNVFVQGALWYLFLEQEFVYVGDAGIVEPSGESARYGFDLSTRIQLAKGLFFDFDLNYAYGRSLEDPDGEDRIPLAPIWTSVGGLSWKTDKWSGGIRSRYLGDRPADPTNQIVAEGYLITDLNLNYKINRFNFGFIIENLFDQEWNETQFATESRLRDELEPVEEIHFTPGVPFFFKGIFSVSF